MALHGDTGTSPQRPHEETKPACRGQWSGRGWARGTLGSHRVRPPFVMMPVYFPSKRQCQLYCSLDTKSMFNHKCQPGQKNCCTVYQVLQDGQKRQDMFIIHFVRLRNPCFRFNNRVPMGLSLQRSCSSLGFQNEPRLEKHCSVFCCLPIMIGHYHPGRKGTL